MKPITPTSRIHKSASQNGFSLVELMVALLISLFLLGGVIQVFLGSKQTYTLNQGVARLQENVRFAFDQISTDISAAGFMGCSDSADVNIEGAMDIVNALTDNASNNFNFSNPVDGIENTGPNGSDTLSIRRAMTASSVPLTTSMGSNTGTIQLDAANPNYANLAQWDIIALSDCATTSVFMITNIPAGSGGLIQHATGITAPASSANAGQSNAITTKNGTNYNDLKASYGSADASVATTTRVATRTYSIQASQFGGGNSLYLNNVELVEGVDNLQVLYGLDNDGIPGAEQYVQADNPDLIAAGMNAVAAVRITLTLNTVSDIQVEGQAVEKLVTQTFRLRNR
ncbi:hypothetical protein MNBD_GAMMA15-751 [hydrothermal vent metagenome]|uniref:Type IV fimbrial biogenesis protein PilW n=1 Tax=hydrothermal vent metagenome TaxID=652676 RepID=A0A3B0ZFA4_9ZZZZ